MQWTSDAFLGYLCDTLDTEATHIKTLHIPASNLPILTNKYKSIQIPSDEVAKINSPTGIPLQQKRTREEIENALPTRAA